MISAQMNMKVSAPRQVVQAKPVRARNVRMRAENPIKKIEEAVKDAVDNIVQTNAENDQISEADKNVRKMGGPPVDSVPAYGSVGTDTKRADDRLNYEKEQAKKDAAR